MRYISPVQAASLILKGCSTEYEISPLSVFKRGVNIPFRYLSYRKEKA